MAELHPSLYYGEPKRSAYVEGRGATRSVLRWSYFWLWRLVAGRRLMLEGIV